MQRVENPPNVKPCDCAMGSFKNILYKATKLTERNKQVLKEIGEDRKNLFKDLPIKTTE